jgi:F-type H+-transporting ATPase subunit b
MLDIEPMLMLFVLVLFLTLLVTLNKMLYRPLLKFMDDRQQTIARDMEAAKNLTGSSEALHAEADRILEEARSQAASVRQKAIDEAKLLAQSKAEAKRSELDQAYAGFVETMKQDKEALKNSLLSQMPLFKESLKAKFSQL